MSPVFGAAAPIERPDATGWLRSMEYRRVVSLEELRVYLDTAVRAKTPVGADWETTTLNVWGDLHLVGLGVSTGPGHARYVPVGHVVGAETNLSLSGVIAVLQELDRAKVETLWWNYRYDGEAMWKAVGWEPVHWQDAMMAVWLANSNHLTFGLKDVSPRLLGLTMREYPGPIHERHPDEVVTYVGADADLTRRLYLLPAVQAKLTDQSVIYGIERATVPVVREGVRDGCWLDRAHLARVKTEVGGGLKVKGKWVIEPTGRIQAVREAMWRLAGGPFEVDSRPQLGQKLLELGVPITERTGKSRQVATGKAVLERYGGTYPICRLVVEYAELTTQCRNYIDKLLAAIDHFGPFVRFAYNQMGAPTGRMSGGGEGQRDEAFSKGVVNLNIQSVPDPEKKPYLPNIRAAWVANDPRIWPRVADDAMEDPEEYVVVKIDYSQLQLRIAANLSREPTWIAAFLKGEDIHGVTARFAYRDPRIDKDHPKRKLGKTMNFAMLFRAGMKAVALQGGISEEHAEKLMKNFMGSCRGLAGWIERMERDGEGAQAVRTHFGRIRDLREFFAPGAPRFMREKGKREAVNDPVQGTEADIFKVGICRCRQVIQQRGWWPTEVQWNHFLHDEVGFRVRRSLLPEVVPALIRALEVPVQGWRVPLTVDVSVGWHWGETVPYGRWMASPLPRRSVYRMEVRADALQETPEVGVESVSPDEVRVRTARERVLRLLLSRPATNVELSSPRVGGLEGTRRVRELREAGYRIRAVEQGGGIWLYQLVGGPDGDQPVSVDRVESSRAVD